MNNDLMAFAYFKHDEGFGYNILTVGVNPIYSNRKLVNFTLVAIDGELNYRTLDELVSGLREFRDEVIKDSTRILGYLNLVTDLAKRDSKNPKELEPSEEIEFMRKLFA